MAVRTRKIKFIFIEGSSNTPSFFLVRDFKKYLVLNQKNNMIIIKVEMNHVNNGNIPAEAVSVLV